MSEATTPAERSIAAGDNRKFFGHPLGLGSLFGVEMMERFSFYGMKAILLYYLYTVVTEGGLGIPKANATIIVVTYGAAVYLLAIVGGYFADRLWGARKTTLYGGIIIMAGHICMALPAAIFTWVGLCLIALGTGFLKPNISTMVGSLYSDNDPRRDAGFEIFYMSINIGAFFSPIVVPFVKNIWGFHAGFAVAAVGMAISLVVYVIGTKALHGAGEQPAHPLLPEEKKRLPLLVLGVLAFVAVVFLATGLTRGWDGAAIPKRINDVVFLVAVLGSAFYFWMMYRDKKTSDSDRKHLLAYIPLFVGASLFFMVFEQAAANMALFADKNTNLMLGNFKIDPEWYQWINPLGIVVMAPFFAWLFTRRAGRFPSTPMKFTISVLLIGISALIMAWMFSAFPGGATLAPFWMLAAVFVLQTVAELFLSPVGLSATTTLAPKHFASQVMGLWFLTSSVGQGLSGQIIGLTEQGGPAQSYVINGILTLAIAAVLLAMVPWTRKMMQDIEDDRRDAIDKHRAAKRASATEPTAK